MTDIIYPDTLLMLYMLSFTDTQRDIYIGQKYGRCTGNDRQ
jgi:hypothetical protein